MKISSLPVSPAILIGALLAFVSCSDSNSHDAPVVDVDKIRQETQQRIEDEKQPLSGVLLDQKLEDVKKEEVPAQSPVEVPVIDPDSGDRKPVPQGKESKEAVEPKEAKPKAGEVDGTAKRLKVIDKPFGSKPIDDHLKEYKALIALFEKKVALVVKGEDTKAIDLEMKKRAEAFNAKGNLVREAVNKLTPKEGTRFNLLIRVNNAELERLSLKLKKASVPGANQKP